MLNYDISPNIRKSLPPPQELFILKFTVSHDLTLFPSFVDFAQKKKLYKKNSFLFRWSSKYLLSATPHQSYYLVECNIIVI